jgi:pimeloyl-ACP methyl ester carboxylesterase
MIVTAVAVPQIAGATSTGIDPPSVTSAPPITWGPCTDPALTVAHAQCGSVAVPLDYANPRGTKIRLAVARVQHSSSSAAYQGVMLTNPGGPGASGLSLATLGQYVPFHVGDDYDWIGFDPRGVGASEPSLSCVPDYFSGVRPPFTPSRPATLTNWLDRSTYYGAACQNIAPDLLPHMHTADSAHDMDTIRVALGVEHISYYGFSYGTYLGQVYATMFPTHLRRMVLDSNVDPRRVGYAANLDQAVAIDRNIKFWFGWLAQYDAVYHLGATESVVEQLFYQQHRELRTQPAAGVIGPDEWDDAFYAAAYNQSLWPLFGSVFSSWVLHHESGGLVAAYQSFDTPGNDNAYAVNNAVVCTDSPWPQQWNTWAHDYWRTYRTARFATWNIAWYGAPCRTWPVAATTPIDVQGEHVSALLVDETLDAATPFTGSLEVRRRFPKARLLAEPWGTTHAGTLLGNVCVDAYIAYYLAANALPPRRPGDGADATCAPLPTPVPAAANASVSEVTARSTLLQPGPTRP